MPNLSVICPTFRVGGLDVLFAGLAGQVYRDFELILVDGLWRRRADLVAERAREYGLAVRHVEPFDNPFPVSAFCRYVNTGLTHATGRIVVFIADYTWLPPGFLALHADFHARAGIERGLMCPHDYVAVPPIDPRFPGYANEEIDRYTADVASGRLDPLMWSLFTAPVVREFDARPLPRDAMSGADMKLNIRPGSLVPATQFHAKGESVALDAALAVNGFDEALDGTNTYQDTDFAERVALFQRVRWTVDTATVGLIVNPRHAFPWPRRVRPFEDNKRIWLEARSHGYARPVNDWRLVDRRAELAGALTSPT